MIGYLLLFIYQCLWRLFAHYRLSAVTLFNHHQQKLPRLIDNKKNHSIWTPNGEMLQASWLCRLSISIKSQAQKLSQSECPPCLALKNSLIWIKVSTLLNLPQVLRVLIIKLGSVVTYWVQRNLSPTASLQSYASGFWTDWKVKTPHQRTGDAPIFTLCLQKMLGGGQHLTAINNHYLCDLEKYTAKYRKYIYVLGNNRHSFA